MFLRRVQLFFLFYAKFFLRKGEKAGTFREIPAGKKKPVTE